MSIPERADNFLDALCEYIIKPQSLGVGQSLEEALLAILLRRAALIVIFSKEGI